MTSDTMHNAISGSVPRNCYTLICGKETNFVKVVLLGIMFLNQVSTLLF